MRYTRLFSTYDHYILLYRTDESLKAAAYLNDTLMDSKTGTSTSADDSPFQRAHGVSFFAFYTTVSA